MTEHEKSILSQDANHPAAPHVGLVYAVAIDLIANNEICRARLGTDPDEYVGFGYSGLARALDNYRPHKGKWTTYAWKVIKQYIVRHARRSTVIRIADGARYQAWREMNGQPVTGTISRKNVAAASHLMLAPVFRNIDPDAATTTDPEPHWVSADAAERVLAALAGNARQEFILRHHFGIGTEPKTLAQIGLILGVTKERVRQLQTKSLEHLRRVFETTRPGDQP